MVKTNNEYYKEIYETLSGETVVGNHNDNYYLKLILEEYNQVYTKTQCKGKMLKDWYVKITGGTVTSPHPNGYYLRGIANNLTGETLQWITENYYLKLISENIVKLPTVTLVSNHSSVNLGESITLTATVLDEDDEPIEDVSVTFKVNGTAIGDAETTDEDGIASKPYTTTTAGAITFSAEYSTYTGTTIVTVLKKTSTLTITPPTLVYSDNFSVSGTLKDGSTGIVDETVTLHWKIGTGNEQTATTTTVSGGAYTFATMTTTSVSDYQFWVTYDGNDTYDSSSTSHCTVTPSKETSVLNTETPTSVTVGDDVVVTGTLTDNDSPTGTPIANATVSFTVNGNTVTATTDSDGEFSKTFSGLSAGSHTISLSYAGDDYYTNCSDSVTAVVSSTYDDIALLNTGTCILSKADSDTVTLTAQLTDNGSAIGISGVGVDFYNVAPSTPVKLNSSPVSTGSNGQASYTYTSQGIGDVSVKAVVGELSGSVVSETYEICDAKLYDPMTSNSGHWVIPSGLTPSYNSNGCTVGNLSAWKCMSLSQQFTNPVSIEFELVNRSGENGASPLIEFKGQTHQSTSEMILAFHSQQNGLYIYDKDIVEQHISTYNLGTFRIDFESSTTVKIYYNDTLIYSSSNWNVANPYFTIGTGANRTFTFKNVVIKPL